MEKRVRRRIEKAEVGDIWITDQAKKRARVVEIEEIPAPSGTIYVGQRRAWVLIPGHPDPYPYTRYLSAYYTTEAPGTCDIPVCELHAREAGEDRHHCRDHWRAWEVVA